MGAVYKDSEFIKRAISLHKLKGNSFENETVAIAYTFCLRGIDVENYLLIINANTAFGKGRIQPYFHLRNSDVPVGYIAIAVSQDIKHRDLISMYGAIKAEAKNEGHKNTKLKTPKDPDLLYAIFKARTEHNSFPVIFKLYESGQLMNNKPTKLCFGTPKELADYYHVHYPSLK